MILLNISFPNISFVRQGMGLTNQLSCTIYNASLFFSRMNDTSKPASFHLCYCHHYFSAIIMGGRGAESGPLPHKQRKAIFLTNDITKKSLSRGERYGWSILLEEDKKEWRYGSLDHTNGLGGIIIFFILTS